MLEGTNSWRDFVWFTAALAGFNLLVLFLAFPEPNFTRPSVLQAVHLTETDKDDIKHVENEKSANGLISEPAALHGVQTVDISNPSWMRTLSTTWKVNHEVNLVKTFLHPLVFLTYPSVVWAIFLYGVSLSPQIILM